MLPYHDDSGNSLVADDVVFKPRYAGINRNDDIAAANNEQPANFNPSVKNFLTRS
jgi:hypothetical protein